jgi:hypothetical protein
VPLFARAFAIVAATLAAAALATGNWLLATSLAMSTTGLLFSAAAARRQEAERRAAFAQRLRAARREPQGQLTLRRRPGFFPARLVAAYVDVDGEARGRLRAPGEDAYPVPAGERFVVVRRPWSAGRATTVVVPVDGSVVVEV